jgi:hypothetical protein
LLPSIVVGALIAPGAAHARVRCGSGATIYQDARLRVFGVHFVDRADSEGPFRGYDEYACARGSRRPTGLGITGFDAGVNSEDVPEIAFDGSRYLALVDTSDGEGGPDSLYETDDLKTGRRLHFVSGGCCADTDNNVPGPIRAGPGGSLIRDEDEIDLYAGGHGQTLSTPNAEATELALVGNTVYWTEQDTGPAVARLATLAGAAPPRENYVLQPVEVSTKPDCAPRRSTTLLRTARFQIYTRHSRRRACRVGHRGSLAFGMPGQTRTARDLRTAGGRWVLALDTYAGPTGNHDVLEVADMRRGKVVTTVDAPAIAQATLLADGTVSWLETGGRLLAQAPGAAGPTVLADAAAAPTALAGGRRTIYWTTGGAPHFAGG